MVLPTVSASSERRALIFPLDRRHTAESRRYREFSIRAVSNYLPVRSSQTTSKRNDTRMAITNPDALIGSTVTGSDGDKLGKVEDIYYDNETGKPEWAAVKSGMFGGHVSLLPLVNATQHEDGLTAPIPRRR